MIVVVVVLLMGAATESVAAGDDRFRFTAQTERHAYSCRSADADLIDSETILGSVIQSDRNGFSLDVCPPTAECRDVRRATFTVHAVGFGGFDRLLPVQAFVRVRLQSEAKGSVCRQRLTVESVGRWLGAIDPAGMGDRLVFAGADGFTQSFETLPFTLVFCPKHSPPGSIRVAGSATAVETVTPSDLEPVRFAAGAFEVRNLSRTACDQASISYWLAATARGR